MVEYADVLLFMERAFKKLNRKILNLKCKSLRFYIYQKKSRILSILHKIRAGAEARWSLLLDEAGDLQAAAIANDNGIGTLRQLTYAQGLLLGTGG